MLGWAHQLPIWGGADEVSHVALPALEMAHFVCGPPKPPLPLKYEHPAFPWTLQASFLLIQARLIW